MRREHVISLFLILLTIAPYWQVRNHEFNFDDPLYVTSNRHVQVGVTRQGIVLASIATHGGSWHPLTWLSHMLDCHLYGLNPRGHHLTNLVLHLVNTLLLFLVLERMTGAIWRSAIVAAMFALHPLHVESVAWVAERKNVLSTLFWMLTIWCYVRYVERPGSGRYFLVLLAFALGLMSKPMVVTIPFVLLLLDYWPLRRFHFGESDEDTKRPPHKGENSSYQRSAAFRLVLEKVPFFALSAIVCVITFFAQQGIGAVATIQELPLRIRLANSLVSYVAYLKNMVWPLHLAVLYPHPGMLPLSETVLAALVLIFISVMVIRSTRQQPYLSLGWLWYLGTLVPVIGLVQVGSQAMADRYTYVPLIGIFIIVVWGVAAILKNWPYCKIVFAISTGMVVLALTMITWRQLHYWQNDITLFKHTLTVTNNNYIIHNNLGNLLVQQGKFKEATSHYYEALRINPYHASAQYNLANALVRQGRLDEAIMHYNDALRIKPNYANAYNNLGLILAGQGKLNEAIALYAKAIKIKPDHFGARNNMGIALSKQGKLKEAIGHYKEALRINPKSAEVHNNLGDAFNQVSMVEHAISHFNEALEIQPNNDDIHYNLANALVRRGKIDKAIMHYTKTLQINPKHADAHNNLGIICARQGKIDEAIAYFTAAVRIQPNFTKAHSNLERVLRNKGLPLDTEGIGY